MRCNVVRDLLPLYFEGMCSEETGKQLAEHLEDCESCRHIKQELDKEQEWTVENADWDKVISPLKKVNKKLRKKNYFIVVCTFLLIVVLVATSILTYGQITKSGISFEMIFEMCRMKKVGKEFAAGNITPLYNLLDNGYEFQDEESSVLRLVYGTLEEYDADMKTAIEGKYKQYFEGKNLQFKGIESIDYTKTAVMGWDKALCISLKFSAEEQIEYYIILYKMVDGSFLVEDYFGEPYIMYEDGDAGAVATNDTVEAYRTEDTLFSCLPNKLRDFDLAFIRHAIMISGQRLLAGDTSLNGSELLCASILTMQDLQNGTEIIREELKNELSNMAEEGLFLTDVTWDVKGYDKSVHLYRYQLNMMFTDKETLEEQMISLDGYRVGNKFVHVGDR